MICSEIQFWIRGLIIGAMLSFAWTAFEFRRHFYSGDMMHEEVCYE